LSSQVPAAALELARLGVSGGSHRLGLRKTPPDGPLLRTVEENFTADNLCEDDFTAGPVGFIKPRCYLPYLHYNQIVVLPNPASSCRDARDGHDPSL